MKQLIRKYFLVGALLIGASTQAATVGLTAITVNGDKMVNDSLLGVTWADITPSHSVTFYAGPGNYFGVTYEGSAQEWISGLNTSYYGGHNDWRLSTSTAQLYNHECGPNSDDELGCLFYNELGASLWTEVTNFGPFSSLVRNQAYWSGTEQLSGKVAYMFSLNIATKSSHGEISDLSALAVRTGLTEVAPVPVPASAWLLLSGLGGLGLMSRKRKTHSG